jgi:hypothetical protein
LPIHPPPPLGDFQVWTGRFERFLEIVFWLPRLELEIALGGRNILVVGAVHFLIIIVTTGSDCDPSGVPLLPLLAALSAFLSAFVGGFGWRLPAATGDRFPITHNKHCLDHLLARGMLGDDIKQFLGRVRLIADEFMHQGLASCGRPECQDGIGIGYSQELITLPREASIVISKGFTRLLPIALQDTGVVGPHIRALKVVGEDLTEILPPINHVSRQVVQPSPGRVHYVNGEELDGE